VIHEIDEALETLMLRDAVAGAGVEVVFDAPNKEWASRRNTPTVDLYLYDIREDTRKRSIGVYQDRDETGVLRATMEPPRFFRLSYLATAWTQRPEDEHRLLSAMLSAFMRHKVIPSEMLSGSLVSVGIPVLIEVAKPPPENRQISEVWTALGGELKASLDLMVTAPMTFEPVPVTAPPASDGLGVRTFGEEGQESEAGAARRTPQPSA
jgi:Pvc16 N-terminal domain